MDGKTLLRLLGSNDPPSDSELAWLTKLRHEIDAQTNELTTAGPANEMYSPLQAQHTILNSVMSPIRRLPIEIIHKIIMLMLDEESDGRIWNKVNTQREPWTLARVCRCWRQAALGEHRLWCSLDCNEYQRSNKRPSSSALAVCLARSVPNPLAILYTGIAYTPLLPHLLQSSERWEDLTFALCPRNIEPLRQVKGRLPELRKLEIYPDGNSLYGYVVHDPFDMFEVAPKLQNVTIRLWTSLFSIWTNPTNVILPWHQLTSLTTDSFDLLIQCPQLVHCSLLHSGRMHQGDPITLPNLRALILQDTEALSALVLPSLELLSLTEYVTRHPIHSLIVRSGCTLKTLEVREFVQIPDAISIGKLIEGWPDLHTAVVYHRELNDDYGVHTPPLPGWHLEFESTACVTYTRVRAEKI